MTEDSVITKDSLIQIVTKYQQRQSAEEIQLLQQKGTDVEWLVGQLQSHTKRGVSNLPASLESRKIRFGSNQKKVREPPGFFSLFWDALEDFTLRILLVAACLSIALETGTAHEDERSIAWIEGFSILIAVIVCASVTAVNDYQKQRQFLQLNAVADEKKRVTVWREGQQISMHQDLLLVGDMVDIREGMEVPADGLLLDANEITTDESAMTGETEPIHKNVLKGCLRKRDEVHRDKDKHGESDKSQIPSPIMMSGTKVLTGEGKMMVLVVGELSCVGKIKALASQQDEVLTPLQAKLQKVSSDIGKFGLISAIFIIVVLLIRLAIVKGTATTEAQKWQTGRDLVRMLGYLILGITVIVVAIPQGLPLSVTLSLAFSVKKMLKDNNLVRKMEACETMGGANNICSDKTGTLTMNQMTMTQIWNESKIRLEVTKQKYIVEQLSKNKEYVELFKAASLVNSAAMLQPEVKGSPTEIAFLRFFRKMDIQYGVQREKYEIIHKFPFSSSRKRMSIVTNYKDQPYLFIKGASEIILGGCSEWYNSKTDTVQSIQSIRNYLNDEVILKMAEDSLRTLCLAYKPLKSDQNLQTKDERGVFEVEKSNLVLIAIVGVRDIPRPEVPQAIKLCHQAGITVRMVTGDNIVTAKAIATQIGIFRMQPDGIAMEGPEFTRLVGGVICKECKTAICDCPRDSKQAQEKKKQMRVDTIANGEEFDKIKDNLLILARSRPEDKYCLVTGLKERGNVVAVTGDGTNDAPALKKADVGFAMGISGTEVARQAAAIILLDDNFNSIVKAVLWGRNIYDSIRKFLQFQLTVNVVAVVITIVGAALLQRQVLKPIQMLWINLIMDTLASLALATEPPNPNLLKRMPHNRDDYIINKTMLKHIIGQSIFQIAVMLTLVFVGQKFIPEYADGNDQLFKGHPQYKWLNGVVGGTVCSGRFYFVNGSHDYATAFDEYHIFSRHFTVIFNVFVMMQVFNFVNARKLYEQFNIFAGILSNQIFPIVVIAIFGVQILLVQFAGYAFGVYNYGLTIQQWLICVGFGSISWIVNFILKLISTESAKVDEMPKILTENERRESNDSFKIMEKSNMTGEYEKIKFDAKFEDSADLFIVNDQKIIEK